MASTVTTATESVALLSTETPVADKLTGKELRTLRAYVDAMLCEQVKAVERAIVELFKLQTADEQVAEETKHHNDRGFNSSSAKSGSYFAGLISRSRRPAGEILYADFLIRARKIALRHSRQLAENIVSKHGVTTARKIIAGFESRKPAA